MVRKQVVPLSPIEQTLLDFAVCGAPQVRSAAPAPKETCANKFAYRKKQNWNDMIRQRRIVRDLRDYHKERARSLWDGDQKEKAGLLLSKLKRDPERWINTLENSRRGCELLLTRWEGLFRTLRKDHDWNKEQLSLALDMLGVCKANRREDDSPLDHFPGVTIDQHDTINTSTSEERKLALMNAVKDQVDRFRAVNLARLDDDDALARNLAIKGSHTQPPAALVKAENELKRLERQWEWLEKASGRDDEQAAKPAAMPRRPRAAAATNSRKAYGRTEFEDDDEYDDDDAYGFDGAAADEFPADERSEYADVAIPSHQDDVDAFERECPEWSRNADALVAQAEAECECPMVDQLATFEDAADRDCDLLLNDVGVIDAVTPPAPERAVVDDVSPAEEAASEPNANMNRDDTCNESSSDFNHDVETHEALDVCVTSEALPKVSVDVEAGEVEPDAETLEREVEVEIDFESYADTETGQDEPDSLGDEILFLLDKPTMASNDELSAESEHRNLRSACFEPTARPLHPDDILYNEAMRLCDLRREAVYYGELERFHREHPEFERLLPDMVKSDLANPPRATVQRSAEVSRPDPAASTLDLRPDARAFDLAPFESPSTEMLTIVPPAALPASVADDDPFVTQSDAVKRPTMSLEAQRTQLNRAKPSKGLLPSIPPRQCFRSPRKGVTAVRRRLGEPPARGW